MSKLKALGLCGVARSGKDTFFNTVKPYLTSMGYEPIRFSFADALKDDVFDFLQEKAGISSFTEDSLEKKLIRNFLVAYGSHLMREINPRYWINKVESEVRMRMRSGLLPVFTDVRYENEVDWINNDLGGKSIHIERLDNPPANKEEEENDPILKLKASASFKWSNFENDKPNEVLTESIFNGLYHLLFSR